MKRIGLAVGLALSLTFAPLVIEAQQAAKIPRIGVLFPGSPATFALRTKAFVQGLGELGYLEGKTVAIEWRWGEDKVERLPELAAELVRLNVDVIVANGTPAIKAVRAATKSIPIVMAGVGDPVGIGLVASLARPGGNVTGLSILAPELSRKRLELLKEVVPKLSRVAAMLNPTNPVFRHELQETRDAARSLGLQLEPIVEVTDADTLHGRNLLQHARPNPRIRGKEPAAGDVLAT